VYIDYALPDSIATYAPTGAANLEQRRTLVGWLVCCMVGMVVAWLVCWFVTWLHCLFVSWFICFIVALPLTGLFVGWLAIRQRLAVNDARENLC
jgi:hypothetical protein